MYDKLLRQTVVDALDWDPSVDSAHIGIAVTDGVVTLSGHVPNYAQKLEAERTARSVRGVKAIAQEIDVHYPGAVPFTDEQIAAHAVEVLTWDVLLPLDAVKVKVAKGWITLSGEVDWDYQRRAAEADVRRLKGVIGVINQVMLKTRVSPSDVRVLIEDAFKRGAGLEATSVQVNVADGKVTLSGKVHTWRERDTAERAAWAAPGVRSVEDQIAIA